ncbi:MAG: hypothetical protein HYZ54_03085 [Ignavibacteriae bacterium]|nr:hypothetical protein [Ignavibacteriota bacterium]
MKITLSTVAAAVVMFAIGCSNNDSSPLAANSSESTTLTTILADGSADFTSVSDEGQFPNDNGETPFCNPPSGDNRGPRGGGPNGGGPGLRDSSKFGQLPRILPCLELTADQMTQLRTLLEGGRTAVEQIMKDERTAEQPFRAAADSQVKAIRAAVAAGTLTRAEAHAQIDAIRTQLMADTKPLREAARAAISDLQAGLIPQIRAILTDAQMAIWDAWMTTGTVPCTPPHGGRGHR